MDNIASARDSHNSLHKFHVHDVNFTYIWNPSHQCHLPAAFGIGYIVQWVLQPVREIQRCVSDVLIYWYFPFSLRSEKWICKAHPGTSPTDVVYVHMLKRTAEGFNINCISCISLSLYYIHICCFSRPFGSYYATQHFHSISYAMWLIGNCFMTALPI